MAALIAGFTVGASTGVLFAPYKGGETQDRLSRALDDLKIGS
ncbi:MAG: YtxH domain-containing protein [Chryseobacterium sp.]|nr:MAG: YtxH domain-containing protein [Chryseobacterium sp.]